MADTVFSDWLTALTKLQTCVEKDLDEIRQQKAEIQQLLTAWGKTVQLRVVHLLFRRRQ